MEILLHPIATVTNQRTIPTDDFWGNIISEITLADHIPEEAFNEIEAFSHLEIIYYFDQVQKDKIVFSGHPRGNLAYANVGIFGQRKKDRPNQLGLCTVELIEHKRRSIFVKYLDAINATPILDIKPVMKEFGVKKEIRQPAWVADLMQDYWK
jgi:tRNA-Thr(GGU) m(6)t(6)A37 methyltransferase TsaA